ncbi:hypothetical protein EV644_110213 [Kribbella orskensis]|uniref:Uncharacterized protein n=1 Tax=Kribbella orskensis TaxID=2512216 RepID=A0ABY2BGL8_9ACTN|nr:hypothetical protein EV642_110235 [Kribbella sp. VKM Ac-2500]TCO19563.1 hypothetical protein EV644_110213 [Kribbella orskensis]
MVFSGWGVPGDGGVSRSGVVFRGGVYRPTGIAGVVAEVPGVGGPSGWGVRRLLPVRRYARAPGGWVFAPEEWWLRRFEGLRWRFVRPLAGLWPVGRLGGVGRRRVARFGVGWRGVRWLAACKAPAAEQPVIGKPIAGLGADGVRWWGPRTPSGGCDGRRRCGWWGPRTPCRGCDGRWRCGWWGPRTPCGDLGQDISCPRSRLDVRGPDLVFEVATWCPRSPPCAPGERLLSGASAGLLYFQPLVFWRV